MDMDTRYKIALAALAGIGIGAAAVHELHAQAKPPAYVVIAVRNIKDADAFKAGVTDKATPALLANAGGRYVVRTQTIRSLDGPSPQRFVMLAFDSVEKAQAWYDTPAIKEINAARMKSTDSLSFIVEGVAD
jgi:uncharacterized protein (DUF1330 family)